MGHILSMYILLPKRQMKSRNLSIFLNFYGIILLLRSQWSVFLHHAVVNSLCCSYRSHVLVVKSGTKYLNESFLYVQTVQTVWLLHVGVHTQM